MSIKNCCNHRRLYLTLLGGLSLGIFTAAGVGATPLMRRPAAVRFSAGVATANLLVLFEPPTDEKVTDSRGGASRPTDVKCIHDETYDAPLTALVPQSGVGLTVASHPTLLAYVPPTQATQAHLTLRDDAGQGLYQQVLPMPKTGGILQIALPPESPELAVGQTYHWSLALLCEPTQTDIPITGGQIRRVERSADMVNGSSLLSQAAAYGQRGVWHDMLASLATLRQTDPDYQGLNANWVEVLQAENLDAIAQAPLLN